MKRRKRILWLGIVAIAGLSVSGRAEEAKDSAQAAFPGYFSDGQVRIISSSHQDTAWMDTPDFCRLFRINQNILPALEMMKKDKSYCFAMECTLHLMEFIEAHPERQDEIVQLTKEGRLEWGATYNQPYESYLSGEELVRQTYFGRRWIKKNLPGCDARVAFNPDVPGRALQMQQILAKAGIPYMFISRYHEGAYRWSSPDGSSVLMCTPGHYMNEASLINGPPAQCVAAIREKLKQREPYYETRRIPPVFGLVNSYDFSRPVDFDPLIQLWNAQPAAPGGAKPVQMRYSSMRGFFEQIDKEVARFDALQGERPDVWLYIHGPTHHWTTSLRREAARLLPAAETFNTVACLLAGSFRDYPAKALNAAWMDEIYIDHGIGGKNGHITDYVFHRKVENARDTGRALLEKALGTIATKVKTAPALGIPVTVFNTLSWTRSDPVEVALPKSLAGPVHVVDGDGKEVPCQLMSLGSVDEINVAAATMGGKATADSQSGPDYGAEKAVNGRWFVRDTDRQLGGSDRWCSAAGAGPHWLVIDFGQPTLAYEVPMGVVEIGKDEIPTTGGRAYGTLDYFEQCRDIRPREVQNFIDASDDRFGISMSSDVSVFDWPLAGQGQTAGVALGKPCLLSKRQP